MSMIVHKSFFCFLCLLIGLIGENSHNLAEIYFIFLKKNILHKIWKAFNAKFGPQWKDWESTYQEKQILVLFRKLIALILV